MYSSPGLTPSGQSIEQQLNDCCIRRILSKDDTLRTALGRRIAELETQIAGVAQASGSVAAPVDLVAQWAATTRP